MNENEEYKLLRKLEREIAAFLKEWDKPVQLRSEPLDENNFCPIRSGKLQDKLRATQERLSDIRKK